MSYASVPVNIPDPLNSHPTYISVPLSKPLHVSQGQIIGFPNSNTGSLFASQLLSPLVVDVRTGGSTGSWVLPSAFALASAFGSNPMQLGTQVGVGDVFIVPVYPLATHTQTGAFYAPAGSTGSKTIPPYNANNSNPTGPSSNATDLIIQFSANGPLPSQYSYYLQ